MQRRSILKGGAALGGTAILGGIGLGFGTMSASAEISGYSISDATTTTTDDGTITGVGASVSGNAEYDGQDTDVGFVEVVTEVQNGDGTWSALASTSWDVSEQSSLNTHAGSASYNHSELDVLGNSNWSAADFADTTEGDGPATTTLTFRTTLILKDNGGNTIDTGSRSDDAVISVNNENSTADAGGSGSTSSSGTDQDP